MTKVWDYIEEFAVALVAQIKDDDKRWGDTWLQRTREGQEYRIEQNYKNYFDHYRNAGIPVPWLKIAGDAMIAWIRENHPELWNK